MLEENVVYIYSTLNNETQKYQTLEKNITLSMLGGLGFIIFALGLSIILIFIFTCRITKPMVELADAAKRITREDFDVKLTLETPNNEIGILTKTFNQMVVSLQNYIANMRQKAETENPKGRDGKSIKRTGNAKPAHENPTQRC